MLPSPLPESGRDSAARRRGVSARRVGSVSQPSSSSASSKRTSKKSLQPEMVSVYLMYCGDTLRFIRNATVCQYRPLRARSGRAARRRQHMNMVDVFGATSTTDEVLSGVNLKGKRILVTGVSAGLGVETARSLAAHGADVVGAARDLKKAEGATAQVRRDATV